LIFDKQCKVVEEIKLSEEELVIGQGAEEKVQVENRSEVTNERDEDALGVEAKIEMCINNSTCIKPKNTANIGIVPISILRMKMTITLRSLTI
jgi:hypothetical protein